jgi:hypothetical protein
VRPSLGRLLLEGTRGWLEGDGQALGEVAESVYRELAGLTHARVIVDDSKTPLYGYFLSNQPWADVVPVRLVRDPRGMAASWSRAKGDAGVEGGQFSTHTASASSVHWLKRVILADRLFNESLVVRYEDLTATSARSRAGCSMQRASKRHHRIANLAARCRSGPTTSSPATPTSSSAERWTSGGLRIGHRCLGRPLARS